MKSEGMVVIQGVAPAHQPPPATSLFLTTHLQPPVVRFAPRLFREQGIATARLSQKAVLFWFLWGTKALSLVGEGVLFSVGE